MVASSVIVVVRADNADPPVTLDKGAFHGAQVIASLLAQLTAQLFLGDHLLAHVSAEHLTVFDQEQWRRAAVTGNIDPTGHRAAQGGG